MPRIVVHGITVKDAPDFMGNHFEGFFLIGGEFRPVGGQMHNPLKVLRDNGMVEVFPVAMATFFEGLFDVHVISPRK